VFAVTKTLKMRKTAIQAYAKDGQSRLKTHQQSLGHLAIAYSALSILMLIIMLSRATKV